MSEIAQVAINGGVSVVLAYVVVRWLGSDLTRRAEAERADKRLLLEVVQRNTEALTRLVDAVRAIGGNGRLVAAEKGDGKGGRAAN